VTSEFGQPIDQANVFITEMNVSVATNAQGVYTITLPAARATGTAANLRVRAIGYQPGIRPIRLTTGSQTQDFALKQDVNRLNEVVVTGTVGEGNGTIEGAVCDQSAHRRRHPDPGARSHSGARG